MYLQGEVRSGGEFPYRSGMTVADGVALAGGYTYRAVTDRCSSAAPTQAVEQEIVLDGLVPLLPGDNIRVPERYF